MSLKYDGAFAKHELLVVDMASCVDVVSVVVYSNQTFASDSDFLNA